MVAIGYGLRIFAIGFYPTQLPGAIVRAHIVLVNAWLCVFLVQAALGALGRMRAHRAFGLWGFAIGSLWALSAIFVWADMLRRETDPETAQDAFILISQILLFALFLSLAWLARRDGPVHKRMMILAVSQIVIGGIQRSPIPFVHDNYARAQWLALLFPLSIVAFDLFSLRRLQRATAWGAALILAVQLVRAPASESPVWLAAARWISSLGI